VPLYCTYLNHLVIASICTHDQNYRTAERFFFMTSDIHIRFVDPFPFSYRLKNNNKCTGRRHTYVIRQLSSRTRHHVLAMAALDKSLSMVWWCRYISVSQLCCCWSMAVSFRVASITICVCFGVLPRECRSLNYSS